MVRGFLAAVLASGMLIAQAQPDNSRLEAEAQRALAAGEASGALAKYEQLAKLVPRSAQYEDQIGFILAATNRTEESIPHFQRAIELDPKFAQGYYHLGVA